MFFSGSLQNTDHFCDWYTSSGFRKNVNIWNCAHFKNSFTDKQKPGGWKVSMSDVAICNVWRKWHSLFCPCLANSVTVTLNSGSQCRMSCMQRNSDIEQWRSSACCRMFDQWQWRVVSVFTWFSCKFNPFFGGIDRDSIPEYYSMIILI